LSKVLADQVRKINKNNKVIKYFCVKTGIGMYLAFI